MCIVTVNWFYDTLVDGNLQREDIDVVDNSLALPCPAHFPVFCLYLWDAFKWRSLDEEKQQ